MGTCRSRPAKPVHPLSYEIKDVSTTTESNGERKQNGNLTSTLLHSLFPIVLPMIRQIACKRLIEKGILLYYEDPVPSDTFREDMKEEELPMMPIQIQVQDINVVHPQALVYDMKLYPDFGWPEKDRKVEDLINNHNMVVFDLINVDIKLSLGEGYEVIVPVNKFGVKVDLEIGYGPSIKNGSVRFQGPCLRIWYVADTRKLYISFLKRPNISPNFNVNADRGKGDFANMNFTEETSPLDNIVERVLCDFGPGLKGLEKPVDHKYSNGGESSWIGEALGSLVVNILKKKGHKMQPGHPLEIDLSENINNKIRALMGKPRASSVIRQQIERLELELKRAEEAEAAAEEEGKEKSSSTKSIMNNTDGKKDSIERKKGLEADNASMNFCGLDNVSTILCGASKN